MEKRMSLKKMSNRRRFAAVLCLISAGGLAMAPRVNGGSGAWQPRRLIPVPNEKGAAGKPATPHFFSRKAEWMLRNNVPSVRYLISEKI